MLLPGYQHPRALAIDTLRPLYLALGIERVVDGEASTERIRDFVSNR